MELFEGASRPNAMLSAFLGEALREPSESPSRPLGVSLVLLAFSYRSKLFSFGCSCTTFILGSLEITYRFRMASSYYFFSFFFRFFICFIFLLFSDYTPSPLIDPVPLSTRLIGELVTLAKSLSSSTLISISL